MLDSLLHDCQPATFDVSGRDVLDEQCRKAAELDKSDFSTNFHPHRRHDQQCQTDRKAPPIKRRLRNREYETRDDTATVPEPNLQTRGDSGLVFPAHVIRRH